MTVLDLYSEVRKRFPEIAQKADEEHMRVWDEIDPDFAYSWFESISNALNSEMQKGVDANKYKELFEYFKSQYLLGDDKVKDCIDVSFTENLFWDVKPEKAKSYWVIFPDLLKELYVKFHRHTPA